MRIETLGRLWATLRADLAVVLVRFGVQASRAEDLLAEAASQAIGDLAASQAKKVGLGILNWIRTEGKSR